ncbi:MAG: sulfite exporter TauE/SafE family protein [Bacteroidota bacterium]
MSLQELLYLLPIFFIVAFLYASVGHGGASGYLAVFALFSIASPAIAPLALVLNIIVAGTSYWRYYSAGYFSPRLLLPFIVGSIPCAFLGGLLPISDAVFSLLLGISLLFAALRLLIQNAVYVEREHLTTVRLWLIGIPVGAVLGFISGMVGIGGGVFLSPLLLFLHWADAKRTAALASAFIILNSISGLFGHIYRANFSFALVLPFAAVVFIGGMLGAKTGATQLPLKTLQRILAVVLLFAGIKMVSKFLL